MADVVTVNSAKVRDAEDAALGVAEEQLAVAGSQHTAWEQKLQHPNRLLR